MAGGPPSAGCGHSKLCEQVYAATPESLKDRCRAADFSRGCRGRYYSTPKEILARGFESWVKHRFDRLGIVNDYAVAVVSHDHFKRPSGTYPYLVGDELKPVAEVFDAAFPGS